ncbi:hypothetical protein LTR08_000153 [Meristemomyces frigidus]|nr:hypothetical protein LTR08_000153 [Meristemomyces frigidus]
MPPRKRVKVAAASPTPTSQPKSPTPAASPPARPSADHVVHDPWADEEEIGLFKGLMQWKPTGIHKHFRLIALHQFMLSNGYIHPRNPHTRPAGIWRKLHSLYDLEALDEREDARQLSDISVKGGDEEEDDDEDVYSEAANKIHKEDFELPEADFADLKWRQRFVSEEQRREESPPLLPDLNVAEEPPVRFTPSFSVEPRSSEVPTPSNRGGRQKMGATRGRGRGAMAARTATNKRRSARQAVESVAGSEQGEEGDGEGEESEEVESRESTPAKATRPGRGRGRGAAAARGRGRGRGRGK